MQGTGDRGRRTGKHHQLVFRAARQLIWGDPEVLGILYLWCKTFLR